MDNLIAAVECGDVATLVEIARRLRTLPEYGTWPADEKIEALAERIKQGRKELSEAETRLRGMVLSLVNKVAEHWQESDIENAVAD